MKTGAAASKNASADVSGNDAPMVSPTTSGATSTVPSRASSAAGSRPTSAAAAAFQQASEAYQEALMLKRLELVQQMQSALADTHTVAYQSIAAYSHCLDGESSSFCICSTMHRQTSYTACQSSRDRHCQFTPGLHMNHTLRHAGVLTDLAFEVFEEGRFAEVLFAWAIL